MKPPKIQNNKGKDKAPKIKKYFDGTPLTGTTSMQQGTPFAPTGDAGNFYSAWNQGAGQQGAVNQGTNEQGAPTIPIDTNKRKKLDPKTLESASGAAMALGQMAYQKPTDIYQSEEDANKEAMINATVDQVGNSVSPYYGLIKGGQGMVKGALAKNEYGEFKPGINAAIGEALTSPTENIAREAAKGNALGVARELNPLATPARAGMKLIGKDKETKGVFGAINKATGQTERNKESNRAFTQQLEEVKKANTKSMQEQAVANRDAGVSPDVQLKEKYDISNPKYNKDKRLILGDGTVYMGPQTLNKGGYVKGGTIVGKGGPKDDAIFTNSKKGIKPGSFIVPAENNEKAKQIRKEVLGDNPNEIAKFKKGGESNSDIAVSNGEHLFTPKEREKIVEKKGLGILKSLAPNANNTSDFADGTDPSGVLPQATISTPPDTLYNKVLTSAKTLPPDTVYERRYNRFTNVSDPAILNPEMQAQHNKAVVELRNRTDKGPGKILPKFVYTAGQGTMEEQYNNYLLQNQIPTNTINPIQKKAQGGLLGNLTERENMREYNDGGLTAHKAKIMLHEGMANGKPITEAQRKYFGWVAGGSKEAKAEGGDIFGANKNGGKIMAPKMKLSLGGETDLYSQKDIIKNQMEKNAYADGGGVNTQKEKAKIKAEEDAIKAKEAAAEKAKKDYELEYATNQKIRERKAERVKSISDYEKRLKDAETKLNALNKAYQDYTAAKEAPRGKFDKAETVWGAKTEANPEKIREDKKNILADIEKAKKEYNSVKQVHDYIKNDKNYDPTTGYSNIELSKLRGTKAPVVKPNPATRANVTPGVGTDKNVPTPTAPKPSTVKGGSSSSMAPSSAKFVAPSATPRPEDEVVVPGSSLSPNESAKAKAEEDIATANADALNKSLPASPDALKTTAGSSSDSSLGQDFLRRFNPESLIGIGQGILGYNMLKKEERPTYKFQLDPTYQASVERAQRDATYGLSPEQKALANEQIANATNDARFAARNLAGGSAGTAYNQEMQAINQGWMNQLGLTSKDQELRMQKQMYADQVAKERAGITTGAKRQAYEDAMSNFLQKQQAGSELVGAGIRNVIGSYRLNKELQAQQDAKDQENAYLKTIEK